MSELTHAVSGAAGGALSTAITYPLITVSIHAQSGKKDDVKGILLELYQTQGIKGLYAGISSALLGMSVSTFVYYYFYEYSNTFLSSFSRGRKLSTVQNIISGAIAGSITTVVTNPIWVVNTKKTLLSKDIQGLSTLKTIIYILRTSGFSGLFNGIWPALVLVLNPIIQYTVFEQLKTRVTFTAQKAFWLGALSKLIATGSTYPYITLKSRMQSYDAKSEKLSMVALLKNIISTEGVASLYKGASVKLMQSIFTAAFLFFFKEKIFDLNVRLLAKRREFLKGGRA